VVEVVTKRSGRNGTPNLGMYEAQVRASERASAPSGRVMDPEWPEKVQTGVGWLALVLF